MKLTHIGGPTALFELGGVRFLTDPTFDDPGEYPFRPGLVLRKLTGPALRPPELGPIDVVLLSHDQHPDNLDHSGRALLPDTKAVLSTVDAPERLPGVIGLSPWQAWPVPGSDLTVTAVPARHGPPGCEPVTGFVTGFVVEGPGVPTVYVSGDNAGVDLVEQIAQRFTIDVAVLFAGAVRTANLDEAGSPLTLTVDDAVTVARLLDRAVIVPVHTEGWAHFTQTPQDMAAGFAAAGLDRLRMPVPGKAIALP
ncbi:MBL fold metallo-hydrolase [Allorhizocola rhizosphaerae]|uniref:MBL fold metallo-hydrolase n=1 Tax=Allorhizocola rhizosphaerae TaxID=1872709 RepID=UPI000E3B747E|nr:MBL fold metallo-hydrolase [Allorhizocola rhizosphaerae]